ncbi:UDP-glucose/GDP-mannose dehydrogenase family protein [Cytobacillus depressus]|uniref:UDP-glucose 6-dehydrogenase n=1 Tax=Cytobacillus depressus TaxID=1602942 RepID=A0A6L3UZC4_9BACI|nr:UDP-glucose/GDP-mannose dehydrogenase family protein [Cytobacillus depressus]KAB2329714.1 UDP-glucose/GDP-mannose dehydrogenase family protein [Cytobacillus depressus]
MKISVAGTGYVGLVTGVCLAEMGFEVTCIDIQEKRIKMLQTGCAPFYEPELEPLLHKNLSNGRLSFTTNPKKAYSNADIIFIAVGTPENKDGTVNVDFIFNVALEIALHAKKDVIICTKSTVPIGTNDRMNMLIQRKKPPKIRMDVASTPEFLRKGTAIHDFFYGDRIVIGANTNEAALLIEQVFSPLQIPIIRTDIRSAEMIKYAANAFLATKISFMNEIAAICEKVGANVETVAYGMEKDKRIGHSFLQEGIGYGGSCLPKDANALVQIADEMENPFELLKAVIQVNNRQRLLPVMKAKELVGSLVGKRVALLGLAFKPGIDDIHEAASLTIINALFHEGANVIGYDPIAVRNVEKLVGDAIEYTTDLISALFNAEVAIIVTDWDEIKQFPLELFEIYMKEAVIIDGRNCYSLEKIQNYDITYVSIGRPSVKKDTLLNAAMIH